MAAKYLLDTNICIFLLRGKYQVNDKINAVGWENCCISEITIAELKYGAECSDNARKNTLIVNQFIEKMNVVPIVGALDIYAKEKAKLRKKGVLIDDFDLLIGATSIAYDAILVTENIKHFNRFSSLKIENWINRE